MPVAATPTPPGHPVLDEGPVTPRPVGEPSGHPFTGGPNGVFGWVKTSSYAIVDQGLFAGAHLLVNVLLARWLATSEYGAFAVAYSLLMFLGQFHTALLTEPMLVLGASKYATQARRYLAFLIYGHVGLTMLASALLSLAAVVLLAFSAAAAARTLVAVAIAAPPILLLWLSRRAMYMRFAPAKAMAGGALYGLLALSLIAALHHGGRISAVSALGTLGVCSLVVGGGLVRVLRPQWRRRDSALRAADILADHWQFGKWLGANGAVSWTLNDAILPAIALSAGVGAAGVFRAYQYLLLPVFHFLSALNLIVVPWASRRYDAAGLPAIRRVVRAFTLVAILTSSAYGYLVYAFREPLVRTIFGPEYLAHVDVLRIWAIAPLILALAQGMQVAARVLQRTSILFLSQVAAAAVAVIAYAALLPRFGLWGGIWARLFTYAAQVTALTALYLRAVQAGVPAERAQPAALATGDHA